MIRFSLIAAAAAPLFFASAASAMPIAPVSGASHVIEAKTVCDAYGQCCATGSGECFYQGRPRRQVYVERPRYYEAPAYGYRERYYQPPRYYGGS